MCRWLPAYAHPVPGCVRWREVSPGLPATSRLTLAAGGNALGVGDYGAQVPALLTERDDYRLQLRVGRGNLG